MKTRLVVVPIILCGLAALTGCTTDEQFKGRTRSPGSTTDDPHKITIHHSHGSGLDWHVDKFQEKVSRSGAILEWTRNGDAPFWIVIRQTLHVQWFPGTSTFEGVPDRSPFESGAYYSVRSSLMDDQQGNKKQVVSLTVKWIPTPQQPDPGPGDSPHYYVLVDSEEMTGENAPTKRTVPRDGGSIRPFAIPYYFYMADAMVVWE
jgi:hypothetical protein